MANQTNASTLYDSYEYYLDYVDLIPVDERKLKANKYLIVIAFWVSLAFFVMLLFLILLYMSWSGSSQEQRPAPPNTPLESRPQPPALRPEAPHRLPRARARSQAAEHPALSGGCGREPLRPAPPAPQTHPALFWEPGLDGDPPQQQLTTGTRRGDPSRETEPLNCSLDASKRLVNSNQPGYTSAFEKPAYV